MLTGIQAVRSSLASPLSLIDRFLGEECLSEIQSHKQEAAIARLGFTEMCVYGGGGGQTLHTDRVYFLWEK